MLLLLVLLASTTNTWEIHRATYDWLFSLFPINCPSYIRHCVNREAFTASIGKENILTSSITIRNIQCPNFWLWPCAGKREHYFLQSIITRGRQRGLSPRPIFWNSKNNCVFSEWYDKGLWYVRSVFALCSNFGPLIFDCMRPSRLHRRIREFLHPDPFKPVWVIHNWGNYTVGRLL